jgi:hypothetical protein
MPCPHPQPPVHNHRIHHPSSRAIKPQKILLAKVLSDRVVRRKGVDNEVTASGCEEETELSLDLDRADFQENWAGAAYLTLNHTDLSSK